VRKLRLWRKAAAGVDGVTAKEYAEALDVNIADLLPAHAIRMLAKHHR